MLRIKFMCEIDMCGFVNCLRWWLLKNAMYQAFGYMGCRFFPELYVRAVGSGTAGTALAVPLFKQGLVKFHCTPSV